MTTPTEQPQLFNQVTPTQLCKIVVLSSGGLKAAWQVGSLKALARQGSEWDIACGCSAGAFNAAFLSMYNIGDEEQACADLERFWTGYGAHLKRPGCIFPKFACSAVFSRHESIETSRLLYDICTALDTSRIKASNRNLHVLASSLSSGGRVFTKDYPYIREAVVASMSVPGLFPPQKLRLPDGSTEWFVDGAVSTSVPHHLATTRAQFDIVMASPVNFNKACVESNSPPTLVETMTKSVSVCMNTSTERAIRRLMDTENTVHIYEPASTQSDASFYNMTPALIKEEIDRGYRETLQRIHKREKTTGAGSTT